MLAAGEALPRDICIAVGGMVVDFKKIETSWGMNVPQSTNKEEGSKHCVESDVEGK